VDRGVDGLVVQNGADTREGADRDGIEVSRKFIKKKGGEKSK